VAAAANAVRAITALETQDFMDLIQSIYQGSIGSWDEPHRRFLRTGPPFLVYDSRLQPDAPAIAQKILSAGWSKSRVIESVDLAGPNGAERAGGRLHIDRLLARASAIVALVPPQDAHVASVLVTVAERCSDVPILAFVDTREGQAQASSFTLRSRSNLCCIALPAKEAIPPFVRGFLHDRWTDGLEVFDVESRMAARHGKPDSRHRDARRIVEAYHAGKHKLL
jgi:hypothetical protein